MQNLFTCHLLIPAYNGITSLVILTLLASHQSHLSPSNSSYTFFNMQPLSIYLISPQPQVSPFLLQVCIAGDPLWNRFHVVLLWWIIL